VETLSHGTSQQLINHKRFTHDRFYGFFFYRTYPYAASPRYGVGLLRFGELWKANQYLTVRCLKIILPQLSYRDSLAVCNLERLDTRREQMVHDLFIEIKEPGHVLHNLLPYRRFTALATRDHYSYELSLTKTFRYSRSFIPHCIRKRY
jgi:hypothetical protein